MSDREMSEVSLFPEFLKRRAAVVWGVVLPSALLALANVFGFWLVWGEMNTQAQMARASALVLTAALPALAGLVAACWRRRAGEEGLGAAAHVVLGILCVAHLVLFIGGVQKALPTDTPDWVIGPSFFLLQFACMMPGVFIGLWRVAGVRLGLAPLPDFCLSSLAAFLPPALLYVLVYVMGRFLSGFGLWGGKLVAPFFVTLMVVGPVLFFVGLLRCLMIVRRFFIQKGEKSRALRMGYVGCVALVLPIAGLLLNTWIPFPADLQNPWPYVLTAVNAVFLMLPPTGWGWADRTARAMRLVLFPFTLYFFVVFLPFLPFSICAILAMGTGFLVLAPTLLFMVHGQELMRDYGRALASAGGRWRLWVRMAALLLVLPTAFMARTERDRMALHRTLDFRYAPDYAKDARLGVAPDQVRRVLMNVRRFKDGAEIPYLTGWYNWRVFDNLLLQDEKAEELWRLIVGGKPPERNKEDFLRNEFASLFGGKTRSPERRRGGVTRPVPRNVEISDVRSAVRSANGETETRVTLKVTSHDEAAQAEFMTTVKVPPGVWVSGLRLKIGERWEDGRVIERKAAEWVYRQIRDVSRRDPAILRYEDEGTLTLRVFPVGHSETREVEIAFLCPDGLAEAVLIGERRVALGDGAARPVCAWAGDVLARNALWAWPGEMAVSAAGSPKVYLVLDCSSGAVWDREALARVVECVGKTWGADSVARVVSANYETVSATPGTLSVSALEQGLLPSRGAFDAAGVLRRLARQCRLVSEAAPVIVFAGATARKALDEVDVGTWQAFCNELPGVGAVWLAGADGAVPVAVRGAAGAEGPVVRLSEGGDPRYDVAARDALIAFTGAGGTWRPAEGMTEMSADSRWAKGAVAWRLQRELDEHPSRAHLQRAILKASRESGVLTPAGAYIVVENSMQWKMLEVKQQQTLAGSAALDLVESPAPGAWLLLALGGVVWWGWRRAGRARQAA